MTTKTLNDHERGLFFWLFVALAGVLAAQSARADTYVHAAGLHVAELRDFSMDYGKIDNYRDPYYPYADPAKAEGREHWNYEVGTNFSIDVLTYDSWGLYWSNRVHGATTNAQFRAVGWQYEAGLQLGDKVQVYWDHHSQHLLDQSGGGLKYPLYNVIGARVTFYRRAE